VRDVDSGVQPELARQFVAKAHAAAADEFGGSLRVASAMAALPRNNAFASATPFCLLSSAVWSARALFFTASTG